MKSKFLKLNYLHTEYVVVCMGKNTTKLFNATSMTSSYYKAKVNHDMPQFAELDSK